MTNTTRTDIPYDEEIIDDTHKMPTAGVDSNATDNEEIKGRSDVSTEDTPPFPANRVTEDPLPPLETTGKDRDEELEGYRKLFEELRADTEHRMRMADEETFMSRVRESYEKDPVAAFRMMVDRSQHEVWEAFQDQLHQELRRDADYRKSLADVMALPANGFLKGYGEELEFLTRDKGFDVNEAAELLRRLDLKARSAAREKAEAARRVRHGSAVESGGASAQPRDPDREFYRIIRKAKTLDDMFEGLRRAGRNGP